MYEVVNPWKYCSAYRKFLTYCFDPSSSEIKNAIDLNDIVNLKLKEYNHKAIRYVTTKGDVILAFDSENHYRMFLLMWS